MSFVGLSESETEALRNSFFPENFSQPQLHPASTPCDNCSSYDSDSDSEISVQHSDTLRPNINVHDLAVDFCENNHDNMILNESQSFDECPVIFDEETLIGDPDVVLIPDKTKEGCGCKRKSFDIFTENEIYQHRLSMRELDKFEKEAILLGKLAQSEIRGTNRCKLTGERQRQNFYYSFNQNAICETAFLLFHDIGNKAFKNLKKHYKENGIETRVHGHKGRRAPNSFPFEVIENVVLYIKNHADENGLSMPTAPRGRNEIPPIYLPSYETKTSVHKQYVTSCCESRHVGLTLFKNIWQHTLPHIQIMKPRSDLCFKCQQHREQISAAVTENEKLVAISAFTEHIQQAQNERDFYNSCIRKSKDKLSAVNIQPGHHQPDSSDLTDIHYIFDYAQLFLFPHSLQPQDLYISLHIAEFSVLVFAIQPSLYSQIFYLMKTKQ
ncbi:hypothetical protein FSP39_022025 [Pinctada imbricata]|uniref:Uncharacterized protein n=1 Tax=Pinctada imbricata TaxID=66713 RepID=A0AA88YVE5_PINIB|nr:hypothetical protein FSP39_022025 [Pinctada imbricata]